MLPCSFRFFTLLLSLTILASFGGNQCALASDLIPAPDDASDYPGDAEIERSLRPMPKDTTLLMAMSRQYVSNYRELCNDPFKWLICVFEAFPRGFLQINGRSRTEYPDFFARCDAAYMKRAQGTVYVLTDGAKVPTSIDCAYFSVKIIPNLVLNLKVDRIILVDPEDWDTKYVFYDRHKDYDKKDTKPADAFEIHPFDAAAMSSVVVGSFIGKISPAVTAINGLISNIDPDWSSLIGDGTDQEPAEKDPGVKTDVLDLPMASLPPSDFKTDDQIATNENPDFTNLSRRRRRALLPRDTGCMAWLDADIFDDPSQSADPSQSDGSSAPNPVAGTSNNADTAAAELNIGKLNVFAQEAAYTLHVTQHRNNPPSPGHYALDIEVFDPQGKRVQYQQNDARAGTEIQVLVPLNPDILLNHKSTPVFVTTGNNDDDPIQIRYGDFNMLGTEANWGMKFDSRDQKCTVGAWTDSQREIRCSIVVVKY